MKFARPMCNNTTPIQCKSVSSIRFELKKKKKTKYQRSSVYDLTHCKLSSICVLYQFQTRCQFTRDKTHSYIYLLSNTENLISLPLIDDLRTVCTLTSNWVFDFDFKEKYEQRHTECQICFVWWI